VERESIRKKKQKKKEKKKKSYISLQVDADGPKRTVLCTTERGEKGPRQAVKGL
jgi:phage/plasmid primase-like uncharacterized protein